MVSSATDPKYRTKLYLDTYLTAANMKKDNGTDNCTFCVMYENPPYPLLLEFSGSKDNDLIFTIAEPLSTALLQHDGSIYGYEEHVPITIHAINKIGFITAVKVIWKAEAELRRIVETYPIGSKRQLTRHKDANINFGAEIVYGKQWILRYKRDTST